MPRLGVTALASVDLDIRQGSDCPWAIIYSERDTADGPLKVNSFAGWSARAQIRRTVGGQVWYSAASPATITLTVAANKLTISGNIGHAVTEDPSWDDRSNGVWDVELVRADGSVIPLASGSVLVRHDVTRAS